MSTTKIGRRYYFGLPGSALPAINDPGVKLVVAPTGESLSAIGARLNANTAETYTVSQVSGLRNYVSDTPPPVDPGPTPGFGFTAKSFTDKRYFGMTAYNNNVNANGGVSAMETQMFNHFKAEGANMLFATLPWNHIEKPNGEPDYRLVDDIFALAGPNQIVNLRFDFSYALSNASIEHYIPADEAIVDHNGTLVALDGCRMPSYDSIICRDKIDAAITAQLTHVGTSSYASKLGLVSVTCQGKKESEYPGGPGGQISSGENITTLSDYSARSLARWRQRIAGWYPNIAAANVAWGGTNYASFGVVPLPIPDRPSANSSEWSWNGQLLQDLYLHRELSLAEFINHWHATIKGVSPNITTLAEFGSVYDNLSPGRGTMGIVRHLVTDGVKNNSQPGYNFALGASVALRTRAANMFAGEEIEGITYHSLADYTNWAADCFNAGANFLDWANPYVAGMEGNQTLIDQAKARVSEVAATIRPLLNTYVPSTYQQQMTVTLGSLLYDTWTHPYPGHAPLQAQFNALRANGDRVRVNIIAGPRNIS